MEEGQKVRHAEQSILRVYEVKVRIHRKLLLYLLEMDQQLSITKNKIPLCLV